MSNVEQEMIPIDVAEIINGVELPTDVFLRLGNEKFIMIAKKQDRAQLHLISAIEKKQVSEVYVRKSDYSSFLSQTLNFVAFSQKHHKFKAEHQTFFLRSASQAVFKEIEQFGPSAEAIAHARSIADSTIAMVEREPSLASIIKGLKSASLSVFNMSVAVSALSVIIAKEMGWQSRVTFEKLALGGLLCDVGLKELPPELINKKRSDMTYDEVQTYETHPYRGLKMLENLGVIPDDVLSIVYEHHENSAGMGYPRKIRDVRLNPLAKVVALAVQFCELTVTTEINPTPRPVENALEYMNSIMGQPFNKEAFQALTRIIEKESRSESA